MTTFGGGTALMFEMIAKRMLDWGNEAKPFNPEDDSWSGTPAVATSAAATASADGLGKNTPDSDDSSDVLPRWHPYSGISDVNPNFRNQAPAMNNQGRVQRNHCNATTSFFSIFSNSQSTATPHVLVVVVFHRICQEYLEKCSQAQQAEPMEACPADL